MEPYTCRRCTPEVRLRNYNALRTHLRADHRIPHLLNSDVSLYESFPGSHQQQLDQQAAAVVAASAQQQQFALPSPPIAGASNVDPAIPLRNEITRIIDAALGQHFRGYQIPAPVADFTSINNAIGDLNVAISANRTMDLAPLDSAISDLNASLQNLQNNHPALVSTAIEASVNDIRNDLNALAPFQPATIELRIEPVLDLIQSIRNEFTGQIRSIVNESIRAALTSLTDNLHAINNPVEMTASDDELLQVTTPPTVTENVSMLHSS